MAKEELSGPGWSAEREQILRKLWDNDMSVTLIAGVLKVTRNAVIGKAHRMHLTPRQNPIGNPSPRPRPPRAKISEEERRRRNREQKQRAQSTGQRAGATATPKKPRPPAPIIEARPGLVDRGNMPGATILTLTDRICKWPIGDPRHPDFHFCGRASAEGKPYCADHVRQAYQPLKNFYVPDDRRMPRSML